MEHGVITIIVAITIMATIIASSKQGHQIWPRRYALHTSKVTIHLKLSLCTGEHMTCTFPADLYLPPSILLTESCRVIYSLIINSVKVYWGPTMCEDRAYKDIWEISSALMLPMTGESPVYQ